MVSADGQRMTTIPGAGTLNVNTLRAIIKQCGLTEAAFLKHYRGK
jgi:predicted RNA binding protein YcfA (HicA-like mRNA interferase family)